MNDRKYDYRRRDFGKSPRKNRGARTALTFAVLTAVLAVIVFSVVKISDRLKSSRPVSGNTDSDIISSFIQNAAEKDAKAVEMLGRLKAPDWVDVNYIDVGKARSGQKLTGIHNIVIHYTGNPGTTAKQNRSYFSQPDTEVCSHFVVGIDGEIIQCVPMDEQSAASNHRNVDTISIEVCHKDKTGKFSDKAYESTVKLAAWLCSQTGLGSDDVIRHHEVTGKDCPLYYVRHEDEWEQMKRDIGKKITETDSGVTGG